MPKKRRKNLNLEDVDQYTHENRQRKNNPPVGLVTPETDTDSPTKKYSYDPYLDPQLIWAGKDDLEFEVDTTSLHVHERIDPLTIIEKVMKKPSSVQQTLFGYFDKIENNPPLRQAIEFYKHEQNWSNRLIAGDSLLVMNSLLEKEGMAGKVQMIYIDPPYGIAYGSNFQPFVNKKKVLDGNDNDLSQEPEMVKAFRDTWELGIHSYLSYLRDRLLLARDLLHETGSCFIQIGDANVHLVRTICDEIFGSENFIHLIAFIKTAGIAQKYMSGVTDFLIWYAKDKSKYKFRKLYKPKELEGNSAYSRIELPDGTRRALTKEESRNHKLLPKGAKLYRRQILNAVGQTSSCIYPVIFEGEQFNPPHGTSWQTTKKGMNILIKKARIERTGNRIEYVRYADDFPVNPLNNFWDDTASGSGMNKIYVVQTNTKVIQRCILMTTDPGDLVLDPTCGSGTTAFVAEQWGRRWITCDTSRVATTLTKQRLMTAKYDYYKLKHSGRGGGRPKWVCIQGSAPCNFKICC